MKNLYVKQKVFSIGEKFTVTDENQDICYYVEGSFFQIPKTFTIKDSFNAEIGLITKKILSFLPKFYVEVDGHEEIILEKRFTFLKPKYEISAKNISINGDWWNMNFTVSHNSEEVAKISKKWFSWGDTYEVSVFDESLESLIVCLVVAIDCVKADDQSSSSNTANSN